MDKEDRERLVRVEENVKWIKDQIDPICKRVHTHELWWRDHHRDVKWITVIGFAIGALSRSFIHDIWDNAKYVIQRFFS